MDGNKGLDAEVGVEELSTFSGNADYSAQDRLRGSGTHTHDHLWMNDRKFCLQPRLARYNLPYQRFLMHAPLAALNPFEMLHGVGEINLPTGNARFDESLVQHTTCRSDERTTLTIFHVAGLFTDKH